MRNGFATIKITMMFLGLAFAYDAGQNGTRLDINPSRIEHQIKKMGTMGKQVFDSGRRFTDIANKLDNINNI